MERCNPVNRHALPMLMEYEDTKYSARSFFSQGFKAFFRGGPLTLNYPSSDLHTFALVCDSLLQAPLVALTEKLPCRNTSYANYTTLPSKCHGFDIRFEHLCHSHTP